MRSMPATPDARTVLRRALRLRCPACGAGPVFREGFRRAESCASCGRLLDRDEGHWLGGAEVLMVVAFGGGAAVAVPLLLVVDPPAAVLHALGAAHLLASLALVRPCRALFLAFDYLLDPSDAPSGPGGRREPPEEPPPRAEPPSGAGRRSGPRPRREAASPVGS